MVVRLSIESTARPPRSQAFSPMRNPANATVTTINMMTRLTMTSTRVKPRLVRECILDRLLKVVVLIGKRRRFHRLQLDASLTGASRPKDFNVHLHDGLRRVVFEFFRDPRAERHHPMRFN